MPLTFFSTCGQKKHTNRKKKLKKKDKKGNLYIKFPRLLFFFMLKGR